MLWVVGVVTSLLTATYMFRLVFMTFHGERAAGGAGGTIATATARAPTRHGDAARGAHLHDAPPAMAIALVLLAIGSVVAGYMGVPHALGGHNVSSASSSRASIQRGPRTPSRPASAGTSRGCRRARRRAAAVGHGGRGAVPPRRHPRAPRTRPALELTLMGVSSVVALAGIGLAGFFFLAAAAQHADARWRARFAGVHRLLLNKY